MIPLQYIPSIITKFSMAFISIEGCEASGKSTQSVILQQLLIAKNIDTIMTKEPGGTPLANRIRDMVLSNEIKDILTEFLLLSAARRDHILTIKEHLEQGKWVITDRFSDSSIAYQGYAKGLDIDMITSLTNIITDGIMPDLTILLDVSIDVMQKRLVLSERHHNFYDDKDIQFHKMVKDAFIYLAKMHPERIVIIDADDDIDMVTGYIKSIMLKRFGVTL